MISLIEDKLEQIIQLCKKHKVRKIELFGSAASGTYNKDTSDLDFLVEFQSIPPVEYADSYFGLKEDLEDLFNHSVDLVETEAIHNPYFLQEIQTSRTVLYAA